MASAGNEPTIPATGQALPSTVEALVRRVVHDYAALQTKLRTWRRWLLLLGVLEVGAGLVLGMPWSIVLLITGMASFAVHESAALMVFGIVLLSDAVINASSLHWNWLPMALVQAGSAVLVLRSYARYHPAEERYATLAQGLNIGLPPPAMYVGAVLPWVGAGISLLALGISMITSGVQTSGMEQTLTAVGTQEEWSVPLPLDLAVVGLALCVAPLAQRRASALAVLGVLVSLLVIGGWIAAMFLR